MSSTSPASVPWGDPAAKWLRAAARFHARINQQYGPAGGDDQPDAARGQGFRSGRRGGRRGGPEQWGGPERWGDPAQWGDPEQRFRRGRQDGPWAEGRFFAERGHGRGPGRRGRGAGPGFGPGFGPGGPGFGPGTGPGGFGPGFGPGGFGPGFGPGGPRGRRRGRGNVRAAILALLAEEPRHGYSIMTELAERSEGLWRPSPGSVYPVLQQLQDEGLVTSADADGRRVFTLTDEGRSHVESNADELTEPWKVTEGGPQRRGRSLLEGMGALGAATFEVARQGTEEQTVAARAILDEARRAMYRLLAGDDDSAVDDPTVQDATVQDATVRDARVQDTPGPDQTGPQAS